MKCITCFGDGKVGLGFKNVFLHHPCIILCANCTCFWLQLSCGVSVCDVNRCNETSGAFRQSNAINLVVEVSTTHFHDVLLSLT